MNKNGRSQICFIFQHVDHRVNDVFSKYFFRIQSVLDHFLGETGPCFGI
jgi:hypothetical protein